VLKRHSRTLAQARFSLLSSAAESGFVVHTASESPAEPVKSAASYVALVLPGGWLLLWVAALADIAGKQPFTTIWFVFGTLPCLAAVVVIIGRRSHRVWAWAIGAIPASFLGPLAPALLFVPAVRHDLRTARLARVRIQPAHQTPPVHPPQQPIQPAVQPLRSYSPPPIIQPAVQPWRPKPQHPYRVLAPMLIGSALAFPVAALAILTLLVLGGEHVVTVTDGHDITIAAAVVAGIMVVATAAVWADKSRHLSRKARSIGWSLIVLVAVPGVIGTVYFTRESAPENLVRPTVTGRAEVGSVLRADPGRWSNRGEPLSFDYQWQACRRSCADIYGATNRSYIPTRRDRHRRIRFRVTATASRGNYYSSDWVKSRQTTPIP